MSAAPRTVGRYVIETLAANGIDTAFGIPGVHNIELYRGLDCGRVRHVLARHEQNAAFAADGYARVSGRVATVFVISGPGLTNALTAVAQAASDSVPMLVIASTPARASLGRRWGVLHELADQRAVAAGAAGLALHANSPEELRTHLAAAFASFGVGVRQRPAYIGIPLDLLAATTALVPESFPRSSPVPQPDAAAIHAARTLLESAQRPLIVAGGGARHAGTALAQLAEALDGYLVTTAAGKGVIPESHPASLGASLPYRATQELLADADVVLAVGTELAETDVYTTIRLTFRGRVIRVDIDAAQLADGSAQEVAIHADARAALEQLAREVRPRRGWRSAAGDAREKRLAIEGQIGAHWRPALAAVRALRAAVPPDGVVFSDMTQIAYTGNYAFAADRPGSWFHPCGYGTLGFALPAAIGARIAQPERPVVALAGDFGVQFTLQELMSAVELQLPLPIVVWNNEALAQIRDDMLAAGIEPVGVTGRNPDFQAFAAACGAQGLRVRGPEALAQAVRAALEARGPTLLEARTTDF